MPLPPIKTKNPQTNPTNNKATTKQTNKQAKPQKTQPKPENFSTAKQFGFVSHISINWGLK